MKHGYTKFISLLFLSTLLLSGCGESPDVDLMKSGLARSGIPSDQANCYAEAAGKTVDGEPYNYAAALMNEGVAEREAINKTRRKFGADFKTPLDEARKTCVK